MADEVVRDEPGSAHSTDRSGRPRLPTKRTMYMIGAPMAVLVALSLVADALTTTWAETHPLALLAMNSRSRILLLVTNQLDALSYYTVGAVRLLLTDPLWYLIGFLYGDAAIQWASSRGQRAGRFVSWMVRNFSRAAWPFVIIAPNPIVSLLAGAARLNVPLFMGLNIAGTLGRLYLIRVVGETFEAPIDGVLRFFGRYRLELLILSVALVTLNVRRSRHGRSGELAELREFAADNE